MSLGNNHLFFSEPSKICFLFWRRRGRAPSLTRLLLLAPHCLHPLSSRQLGPDPRWRPSRPFSSRWPQPALGTPHPPPPLPHGRHICSPPFYAAVTLLFKRENGTGGRVCVCGGGWWGGGGREANGRRESRGGEGGRQLTLSGCETKMAAETFCLLPLVLVLVSGAEY